MSIFKRPFIGTPELGIERTFHYDPETETFVIQESTDVEALMKQNKMLQNEIGNSRHGEKFTQYASIPLSLYAKLQELGIAQDEKAFKKWLDDPDNRVWRVHLGKLGS